MRSQLKGKRKGFTNFVDAYSGASQLAPPPSSKDVFAVPAKLRRIMELKGKVYEGPSNGTKSSSGSGNGTSSKAPKIPRKDPVGKTPADEDGAIVTWKGHDAETLGKSVHRQGSATSRWKRGEEELKLLVDKLDKREKRGVSSGLRDSQKRYLAEKKNRKKGKPAAIGALPALNQYENIGFGDVVQAPPKLSFPTKAAQVKAKEKAKGAQDVLLERLRSEAIEAYRQRRVWSSRPSGQQPFLSKIAPLET